MDPETGRGIWVARLVASGVERVRVQCKKEREKENGNLTRCASDRWPMLQRCERVSEIGLGRLWCGRGEGRRWADLRVKADRVGQRQSVSADL